MPSVLIIWNDEVIAKLAQRGISPEEFEDVVLGSHKRDVLISRSSGRPIVFGMTQNGRCLACVFDYLDDDEWEAVPITAWEVE